MHATLVNKHTNEVKNVKIGFSWTECFFGFWSAIFRQDWKWLIIIFLVDLALGVSTWGGGLFVFNLIFGFFYNKLYINDLINSGYEPKTQTTYDKMVEKNYLLAGRKFTTLEH